MKTVLITGCSSGFGLAIAETFLARGWQVVATQRAPGNGGAAALPASANLRVLPLDVTDAQSVRQAIEAAGPLDALVNNAGIGVLGALEGCAMASAREVFETNALGTIAMSQAVLPQFRQRKTGVIVNITSSVTLQPMPLLAVYTASKAAVNAFSESLAMELAPFDVRVRLVLPGRAPETRFGQNAQARMQGGIPEAYAALAQKVFAEGAKSTAITQSVDVAEADWRAVTDPACPMRLPAGADAVALARSL